MALSKIQSGLLDSQTNLTLTTPTISGILTLGGGIKFPATNVVSSDANTLDDYEEGTWTPDIRNADQANNFSIEAGYYVKWGRIVWLTFRHDGGTTGSSGGLQVRNIPFAATTSRHAFGARGIIACNNSTSSVRRNLHVNINTGGDTTFLIYYGGDFLSDVLSYVSGWVMYETDA